MATAQRTFNRSTILERLHKTLADRKPIISASAGAGIAGKCAEHAGADLIVILSTGRSRWLGVPTTITLGNSNQAVLSKYREIENVVDNVPIIGGFEGTDPTYRKLPRLLNDFITMGFDGLTNFPSSGANPTMGQAREHVGQGGSRELEVLKMAKAQDMFTMGMAFSAEHARQLAGAGVDMIVARCGATAGGLSGPKEALMSKEEAVGHVQEIIGAAKAVNSELLFLATGGPWSTPRDVEYLFANTDVHGFHGESAIERIPVEEAIAADVRSMKDQWLRTHIKK